VRASSEPSKGAPDVKGHRAQPTHGRKVEKLDLNSTKSIIDWKIPKSGKEQGFNKLRSV
jgi:hypothetical protein